MYKQTAAIKIASRKTHTAVATHNILSSSNLKGKSLGANGESLLKSTVTLKVRIIIGDNVTLKSGAVTGGKFIGLGT